MKKFILALFFNSVFVLASNAAETLKVSYVFDSVSGNYSSSDRKIISDNLNNQLNYSFLNSGVPISFIKVKVHELGVLNNESESLFQVSSRYKNNPNVNYILRSVQSADNSDIVITIIKGSSSDYCGQAVNIPKTSSEFSDPNNSYIFANSSKNCLDSSTFIAHEVGHIMGLSHGGYVAYETGESAHFDSSSIANGFGKQIDYGLDYGTIMVREFAVGQNNRFSDPSSYNCGSYYWDKTNICGNYQHANAVKFLTDNASNYKKK